MKEDKDNINFKPLIFALERVENDLDRIIHYIIIFFTAIFLAGIIYGGVLGDFVETESVGSIMCLSCMGLEQ